MTNIWGPLMWRRLHSEMKEFKDEETTILQLNKFINDIPCGFCKMHVIEFSKVYPPKFNKRRDAEYWAFNLHNTVNIKLGKPVMSWAAYIFAYKSNFMDLPFELFTNSYFFQKNFIK